MYLLDEPKSVTRELSVLGTIVLPPWYLVLAPLVHGSGGFFPFATWFWPIRYWFWPIRNLVQPLWYLVLASLVLGHGGCGSFGTWFVLASFHLGSGLWLPGFGPLEPTLFWPIWYLVLALCYLALALAPALVMLGLGTWYMVPGLLYFAPVPFVPRSCPFGTGL